MNGNGEMIDSAHCSKVAPVAGLQVRLSTATTLTLQRNKKCVGELIWCFPVIWSLSTVTWSGHGQLLSIRLHLCTEAVELSSLYSECALQSAVLKIGVGQCRIIKPLSRSRLALFLLFSHCCFQFQFTHRKFFC